MDGRELKPQEDLETSTDRRTLTDLLTSAVTIFSRLVAIPVFIFAHKSLPNPDWAFHLDRIILLIVVFGITELLIKLFRNFVIICMLVAIIYLTVGSITGKYGFTEMVRDYKTMVVSMYESPDPQKFIASKLVLFPNRNDIVAAIDYGNPEVRDFALKAVSKHFVREQKNTGYRTAIQCFAIFKEINANWIYVSDPKSREYYALASESQALLAGDCDDYSILMAACIKSVGGTARLIHTQDHLYPEMLIGSRQNMEEINYIIKRELFINESRGKSLHFHIDENNQIWLNMDYTARYPGGNFMSEKNLGVIAL